MEKEAERVKVRLSLIEFQIQQQWWRGVTCHTPDVVWPPVLFIHSSAQTPLSCHFLATSAVFIYPVSQLELRFPEFRNVPEGGGDMSAYPLGLSSQRQRLIGIEIEDWGLFITEPPFTQYCVP